MTETRTLIAADKVQLDRTTNTVRKKDALEEKLKALPADEQKAARAKIQEVVDNHVG